MTTGDAFGFSPDVGRFVLRNDLMYTEHGAVYTRAEQTWIRSMPTATGEENYADWSDGKRAEVAAENARKYALQEEERKAARQAQELLVLSAKAKLTEEEFDAVRGWEESTVT